MKKIYIKLLIIAIIFTGCKFESFTDDGLDLTSKNSFVRLNQDDLDISAQEGDIVIVNVESPTAQSDNLTVQFEVTSEKAVFGVDYSIDGATETGGIVSGSIEILHKEDPSFFDNADIEIEVLVDGVTDGDMTLVLKLVSITSSSGKTVDVGQGSINIESTILLADIDFILDLSGTYDSENCYPDPKKPSVWVESPSATYSISDFSGGYYGFAGAPDLPVTIFTKGSAVWADNISFFNGALEFVDISGSVNQETGVITLNWTEQQGFANGGNPFSCSTEFVPN